MIELHSVNETAHLSAKFETDASIFRKAQINAGALIGFNQNLSEQNKKDVQNSLLFAQLAANTAHDRYGDPSAWFKKTFEVLSIIGWTQISTSASTPSAVNVPANWPIQILEYGSVFMSDDILKVMTYTLELAGKLPENSKALNIWAAQSSNASSGIFMNGVAYMMSNDDLFLDIVSTYFHLSHNTQSYAAWETDAVTHWDTGRFALNADIYQAVRKQIERKLSGRISQYVAAV